ncbi:hypothetical protein SRB5_17710 [Streptomyces sp. RB5]|uniref:Signal transduction histidine kinase subgroup 3 dimerisation and phosphoacceptor domain-containing protein n=1 Tax=Streptomyces smaragdinus TaxID=2585196 RepID=A0A7K0CF36_9ACTN|nr:histidine kinase [Streptomyces smaragdinus]MQY11652.1 hypothetical protein [Streptomyces smaragdinus]
MTVESAQRTATLLLTVLLSSVMFTAILHLVYESEQVWQIGFGCLAMAGIYVCQLYTTRNLARIRLNGRTRAWLIAGQAVLTYVPIYYLSDHWVGLSGMLAATVLLTMRGSWAWLLAFVSWSSVMVSGRLAGYGWNDVAWTGSATLTIACMVYAVSLLADLVVRLRAAQDELAHMAVEQERLRFSRDLHDLLGISLSAITLRSELSKRLVDVSPGRAKEELTAVLETSRQALADLRAVSRKYRELSFAAELKSVVALLDTAGVRVTCDTRLDDLETDTETVLATVLREAVSNVLRHSSVRVCRIEAGQSDGTVRLSVVNDGLDPAGPTPQHDSSGLQNLSQRVHAIGGTLEAEVRPDGCFGLTARVPVSVAAGSGGPQAPLHQDC